MNMNSLNTLLMIAGFVLSGVITAGVIALNINPLFTGAIFIVIFGAMWFLNVEPGHLLKLYVCYIMFEGMIKILSNYNPILHVGSDLFLLGIFARLYIRMVTTRDFNIYVNGNEHSAKILPYLYGFWLWVALQFFNPWGIGLLPSVASFKLYVVPVLLFFMVTYMTKDDELHGILHVMIFLGLIQGALTIADASMGDSWLPSIHPRYRVQMGIQFVGSNYRPFGTTNLPGGPSIWIYQLAAGCLLLLIQLSNKNLKHWLYSGLWRIPITLTILVSIPAFLMCQVRSALIRLFLLIFSYLAISNPQKAIAGVIIGAALLGPATADPEMAAGTLAPLVGEERAEMIATRFLSLGSSDTWKNARHGALEGSLNLAEKTTMGIGLSRTGAASAIWKNTSKNETYFGDRWGFTDNVYRALFTELGLFGLVAFCVLMFGIFITLLTRGTKSAYLMIPYLGLYLLQGRGSEGILYLPDAHFLWLFVGLALRSEV